MTRPRLAAAAVLAALLAAPAAVPGPGSGSVAAAAGPATVASAIGLSRSRVRLRFSAPLSRLGAGDVALSMGGVARRIVEVRLAEDGASAEVDARPAWPYATAGEVRLRRGAPVRVWASPGDMTPPVLAGVRLTRSTICVTGLSRSCRASGGEVAYRVDEKVTLLLDLRRLRGHDAPSVMKLARPAGRGTVRFNTKIEGRRLRPGSYRLAVTAVDAAGNESRTFALPLRVRR